MFNPKICEVCGETFTPAGGCQKTCNKESCRTRLKEEYNREYHSTHYKKRGYNQGLHNNNAYKNGKGFFRKYALDNLEHRCSVCGKETTLCVHHKDENRENNSLDNLTILCKACHQKHHAVRGEDGRYAKRLKV